MELKEYLNGKVPKVVARIGDALESDELGVNDLVALQELEAAGEKRQGVLVPLGQMVENISAHMSADDAEELDLGGDAEKDKGGEGKSGDDTGADKAARGEAVNEDAADKAKPEIAAWKKIDYSGALTGDQAAWRNKNLTLK